MSDITLIPGLDISAEGFLLANTALATGQTLSGQISQTGSLDILGQGEIVTHWNEYAFTLGDRTFRYVGDFVSTVDQSLAGSVSSITGNFDSVIIEDTRGVIAELDLDSLVGVDFGSVTSLNLLGLDLGEITSGLLETLLGDGPDSVLDLVTGSTSALLETIQGLIDTENASIDPLHIKGTPGNDHLRGRAGNDVIRGLSGNDVIRGYDGNDSINGDGGNDRIYGDAGNDHLSGGSGKDRLWGGIGNDHLVGGAGKDILVGDDGDDILFAGKSNDHMTGGSGADTFVFMSVKDSMKNGDLISDFSQQDGDQIDVSHFKHAEFIGNHEMSGNRGEVQVTYSHGDTFVRGDFNGDGKGEFVLHLDGHIKLNADDFNW